MKTIRGSEETAFTVQYDFVLPKRFELEFIDQNGKFQQPIAIHRSSVGAIERTMAFLIEHYQGAFPTWLSPVQVQIVPITDRNNKYGQNVLKQLKYSNIRVELDDRGEKMQGKIRDAQLQKIPYMLIIGDREEKEEKVAVRTRDGKDLGALSLEEFIQKINKEIAERS